MGVTAAPLTPGRTFALTFADGDDFFGELTGFCRSHGVRYGYIPLFLGSFRAARIVGTCRRHDPETPMLDAYADVQFVETVGAGTIAYDHEADVVLPHVHLSVGERLRSATSMTSHLFAAEVQFLTEMILVEVAGPAMTRPKDPAMFGMGLLRFGSS